MPAQDRIYVAPYPGAGTETTLSTTGGREPVWSPNDTELFYRTEDQLMVVTVSIGASFRAEAPRPLVADGCARSISEAGDRNYDIAPDGQRFVMIAGGQAAPGGEASEGARLILVQNFFEELRARVPN